MTSNYFQLVAQIREFKAKDDAATAAKDRSNREQRQARFAMGRCWLQCPEDQREQLATDAGVSRTLLRNYAATAQAWPDGSYPDDASYTVLEELRLAEDRFDLIKPGMSKRAARQARGAVRSDTSSRWTPAQKAMEAKRFLDDPEVARQLLADQDIRITLAKAELARTNRQRDAHERLNPARRASRERVEYLEVRTQLANARRAVARVLDTVMENGLRGDEAITTDIAALRSRVEMLETYMTTGSTANFDQDLEALLEGE